MKIESVQSESFSRYGRVLTGCEAACAAVVKALNEQTPLPAGVGYVPEEPALQSLPEAEAFGNVLYGGQPVQFGWCSGHNTKLNCLEYHRDSEFNLGTEDFILLLAKQDEIRNGRLDTAKVRAFRVPAGALVEVYATTLHYAPCHTDAGKGFRVMVALPKGTNTEKPAGPLAGADAAFLWARNKWLLAHAESAEAAQGATVALTGVNLDLSK
jgi:hypothetical protein